MASVLVASVFVLRITSPSDGGRRVRALRVFGHIMSVKILYWITGLGPAVGLKWMDLREAVPRVNTLFNPKRLLFLILIFFFGTFLWLTRGVKTQMKTILEL